MIDRYTAKNSLFPMAYPLYIFKRYASNIEHKKKNPFFVPYKTYFTLIRRFHEKMMDKVIFNQHEFKMPYRLGAILVVKRRPKIVFDENGNIDYSKSKLKRDFSSSKKYGKKMYYYNNHTKGYYMRFHWRKHGGNARIKNISLYKFEPIHQNKQKLSVAINKYYVKGKIDFYKLEFS